jgi:hypothetical protein
VTGFKKEVIEAVGGDWEFSSLVNIYLVEAASKRVKSVRRDGDLARSLAAWKIATLEQALRYRLCALAEGAICLWNAHNSVSAVVLARAVVETTALIIDFERKLKRHLAARDLASINKLADKTTFSSRQEAFEGGKGDRFESTNILTQLDVLGKRLTRIMDLYHQLSDIAHPNGNGHYFYFGSLNADTGEYALSEASALRTLSLVHAGCGTLMLASSALDKIVAAIPEVADLEYASAEDRGISSRAW